MAARYLRSQAPAREGTALRSARRPRGLSRRAAGGARLALAWLVAWEHEHPWRARQALARNDDRRHVVPHHLEVLLRASKEAVERVGREVVHRDDERRL